LKELNIYPNPVTHELNINGLAATSEIVLTNSLGVEVLKLIGMSKIDVSNLPSGVYLLHNEGKSYKLIKR
jgi:hypothetical protein